MSIENPARAAQSASTRIAKTAHGLAGKANKAASEMADQAETRIAKLADKAEHAARRAETVLHDGIETLRSQSRAYADQAADGIENAQRVVTERVREKPLTGIAIAAGAGLILGLLLGSRRN